MPFEREEMMDLQHYLFPDYMGTDGDMETLSESSKSEIVFLPQHILFSGVHEFILLLRDILEVLVCGS